MSFARVVNVTAKSKPVIRPTASCASSLRVNKPRTTDVMFLPWSYTILATLPRKSPRHLFNYRLRLPRHTWDGELPLPQYETTSDPAQPMVPLSPEEAANLPEHFSQYISGYIFTKVEDPVAVRDEMLKKLAEVGALGRIYLNEDGTNVQMACHPRHSQAVVKIIKSIHGGIFANMRLFTNEIIDTSVSSPLFDKLSVRIRPLLNDGLPREYSTNLDQYMEDFNHLSPKQWHEEMTKAGKDAVILDMRNTYEYEVGAFQNALPVDVPAYRDTFPELDRLLGAPNDEYKVVNELKVMHSNLSMNEPIVPTPAAPVPKDKKIFIYCTGGIRCLKVGAYLSNKGYSDVNTLEGGINAYTQFALKHLKNPMEDSLFRGVNVVFDDRRGVRVTKDVISRCHHCNRPADRHRNCSCDMCDILFIQCKDCETIYNGACSIKCNETQWGYGDIVRENIKKHNRAVDENLKTHKCGPECAEGHNFSLTKVNLNPAAPAPSMYRPRFVPLTRDIPQ